MGHPRVSYGGAEVGEVCGSFFGAHGAGDFLSDLGHPDFLFCGVVRERDRGVVREFQVVGFAFVDAAGQGCVFAADGAGGVGSRQAGRVGSTWCWR